MPRRGRQKGTNERAGATGTPVHHGPSSGAGTQQPLQPQPGSFPPSNETFDKNARRGSLIAARNWQQPGVRQQESSGEANRTCSHSAPPPRTEGNGLTVPEPPWARPNPDRLKGRAAVPLPRSSGTGTVNCGGEKPKQWLPLGQVTGQEREGTLRVMGSFCLLIEVRVISVYIPVKEISKYTYVL